MNCEDAKAMIWAGERSPELEEHLETCSSCQDDLEDLNRLTGTLGNLNTPAPSRSLQPSREIIRAAVRKNRRKRWMSVTTIAASLALVIGVGAWAGGEFVPWGKQSTSPLYIAPHVVEDSTEVSIRTASYPEFTAPLKTRLEQVKSKSEYLKIEILDFTPKPGPDPSVMMGKAKLYMEEEPNFSRAPEEKYETTILVRFVQEDGKWVAALTEYEHHAESMEEFVQRWAEAVKNRDGFLEYTMLAMKMKERALPVYQKQNWQMTAQGQVRDYKIERVEKTPDYDPQSTYFNVTFTFDDDHIEKAQILLMGINQYQIMEKFYLQDTDNPLMSHSATLPDGTMISSDGEKVTYQGIELQMKARRVNLHESGTHPALQRIVFGDDSAYGVMTTYPAKIPELAGGVYLDKMGADNLPTDDTGLIVGRADPDDPSMSYLYVITAKGNKVEAREILKQLATTWKLPQ